MEQVLSNLLTNAAKYTPDGGEITVRGQVVDDNAVLSVRDNGIGIAPEMLPRVFDLFVQVDGTSDRSHGGLGIGLALARKIAEMHGGSVEAKSDGINRGSEFVVSLPLAKPAVTRGRDRKGVSGTIFLRLFSRASPMKLPRRSVVVYSIALVGVGAATAIRFLLDPMLGEHLMFSTYFLAVSVAAWVGGVRPAMVTAILCSILANYLFSKPRGHWDINSTEELCGLIVFLSESLVIGVLGEVSLKSIDRAREAEQQKDDFLAILAHELRNPLAVIHYTNLAEQARACRMPRRDRKSSIARCSSSIK